MVSAVGSISARSGVRYWGHLHLCAIVSIWDCMATSWVFHLDLMCSMYDCTSLLPHPSALLPHPSAPLPLSSALLHAGWLTFGSLAVLRAWWRVERTRIVGW